MPTWRCPHCGTPQDETARCWVCRRSSTACGTCRHFRRSVAAQLGFCGLDARRSPLAGDEIRGCWEAAPAIPIEALTARRPTPASRGAGTSGRRDFVELAEPGDIAAAATPTPGWSLWGDADL